MATKFDWAEYFYNFIGKNNLGYKHISGIKDLENDKLFEDTKKQIDEWAEYRTPIKKKNWDIIFLEQANFWAKQTNDGQTGCGAVLTTPDHRIISTGYNGFIYGIPNDALPNLRPAKYPFMVHAEHNAILDCAKQGRSSKGGIMYVTGEPCLQCYQYIYQAGVKEVVWGNQDINMLTSDPEYNTKKTIFLTLVADKFKSRHVNYPVSA
jgi:dCMP deaminase